MAEFGKRNAAGRTQRTARTISSSETPDVAGAIDAVRTGKLPAWTKGGPGTLFFLMFLALAGIAFIFYLYGSEIVRDVRLSGTWQPAYDLQAADGRCKRYQFIVTDCSATLTSAAEADRAPVKVGFLMLFTGGGGEVLMPVRSTADPTAVSVAYAAETELANRTITFLVMQVMFVSMLVAAVRRFSKGRYAGGAAHRALMAGFAELEARAPEPAVERLAA